MKKRMQNKLIWNMVWGFVLITSLLSLLSIDIYANENDKDNSVVFSVEAFTIGQGYVVEPVLIENGEGKRVDELVYQILKKRVEAPRTGYYLKQIVGADKGAVNIPIEISKMQDYNIFKAPSNENNIGNDIYPALGEYSYSPMAGWMYTVNNELPSKGMHDFTVSSNDVVRIQFSVYGYGADLGYSWDEESKAEALTIANKDELTRKLAKINYAKDEWIKKYDAQKVYEEAVETACMHTVSQNAVDCMVEKLPDPLPISDSNTNPSGSNDSANNKDKDEESKKDDLSKDEINQNVGDTNKKENSNNTNVQTDEKNNGSNQISKPSKVQKIRVSINKKGYVTIKWKKVTNADGYVIYRSTKKASGYKKIKTIKSKKTISYTDKSKKKKKTYYYKICAYKTIKKKTYYGTSSSIKKVKVS